MKLYSKQISVTDRIMLSGPKVLPEACAKLFSAAFLPLSLADHPAFKEFLMKVNGALKKDQLPTRKQVTTVVEEKAPEVRAWVKDFVTSDIYGYSITVDKWSAGKHRSFFGIVSHKMNTETGIIEKQVLDGSEFEDTATAENIALHANT